MLRKFLPLEESRATWVRKRVGADVGIHLGGRLLKTRVNPVTRQESPEFHLQRFRNMFDLSPFPAMLPHELSGAAPDTYSGPW